MDTSWPGHRFPGGMFAPFTLQQDSQGFTQSGQAKGCLLLELASDTRTKEGGFRAYSAFRCKSLGCVHPSSTEAAPAHQQDKAVSTLQGQSGSYIAESAIFNAKR